MPITATSYPSPRFPLHRFARQLLRAGASVAARARDICGALVTTRVYDAPANVENPWQAYWGEAYGPELKEWLLKPVFAELEKAGKIGDLIVDVGSGAKPVTQLIESKPGRKRLLVDIAADNSISGDTRKIRLDAGKIAEPGALSLRKALLRACRYLGLDPRAAGEIERADTMVFSDLLNYVDFEKVLGGFAEYLKPGGRMIISNLPMRGNISLFSEKGLKDNRQLYRFLLEHNFEIEQKSFPKRHPKETSEAEELIVLVARKCPREIVLNWGSAQEPAEVSGQAGFTAS